MRPFRIPLLAAIVTLAAAAPAGAAGGGAVAPLVIPQPSGGAAFGDAVPDKPKPKPKPAKPKRRRHATRAHSTSRPASSRHAFPIDGSFAWGGRDSLFGARRKGHRHKGQDLQAASGTPVVAPHSGVVVAVEYQAHGAGHYVVLDSLGEDFDYVFMHLRTGSVRVLVGDRVRTGERLGEVGSTGESTGPHLHFEIWDGSWFAGGRPIDPLPLLRRWAR